MDRATRGVNRPGWIINTEDRDVRCGSMQGGARPQVGGATGSVKACGVVCCTVGWATVGLGAWPQVEGRAAARVGPLLGSGQ